MSIAFSPSTVDDTECLKQALREYRESSWDDRDFGDMPSNVRHVILQRAQEIKNRGTRLEGRSVTSVTATHA